ncbi:hypothetical protein [Amycolatopsis nigrescens]|uniref:hypothetical protein n=1 Tax=Amycolatopsis nigrescens TaxID=381445 RepID=UPI000364BF10|nr:hypothetical protein [Amycolatopsis nigrescens]
MNRAGSTIVATTIGLAALLSACSDDSKDAAGGGSSGDYCADVQNYLKSVGEYVGAPDPAKVDDWLTKTKAAAGSAPAELKSSWTDLVSYTEKVKSVGGDPAKLSREDIQKNGAAGTAVVKHAEQNCKLTPGG